MVKLAIKNITKYSIKKRICIHINLFLARLYGRFRECSGIAEDSKKILDKYKENESKVEIVEEHFPRIVSETDKLISRNKYLEARVMHMFNELNIINNCAKNGEIEMIISILKKYDFSRKLEY